MDYSRIILSGIMVYAVISLRYSILYVSDSQKEIVFSEKIDRVVSIILGTIFYAVFIFVSGLAVYGMNNMINSFLVN